MRNHKSRSPEGPRGQSRVQGRARGIAEARARRAGQALVARPHPQPQWPQPGRGPPRGAPRCLVARAPHTHHTQAHRPGPAALGGRGPQIRSGTAVLPCLPAPPSRPRPGSPGTGRSTHLSFSCLRQRPARNQTRGQQAGVVRSAGRAERGWAPPGHSSGAPGRASVVGKSGPRAPSHTHRPRSRGLRGAQGLDRVTGEPPGPPRTGYAPRGEEGAGPGTRDHTARGPIGLARPKRRDPAGLR